MKKKKIMILGASILQLPAIRKAKEMGLDVVVVDMNPNAIGFKEEGIIKEIISTNDIPNVLESALNNKIDGIMTLSSDMPIRTVAEVAERMGLVGVSRETALKATNKIEMRNALKEHGVPIPMYYKISSYDEFLSLIKSIDKPVIIKPSDSSGSRGVYKIDSVKEVDNLLKIYEYSAKYSKDGDVIVEEYMDGAEVSVETFSIDGECRVIQVTDKITTGAPYFAEIGHTEPSQLDADTIKKIKDIAIKANKAIGIVNGPSHTEIIVTTEGPKIVEIGARLGGDCITSHLVPLSTGVDMVKSQIDISLGNIPNIEHTIKKASAIRYFCQKSGLVKNISGIEEARKIPNVKTIEIVHNIGEYVTGITDSVSRMGFVISDGNSVEEAIEACNKALQTIKIDITDENIDV